MSNVISLRTITYLDLPPDRVLEEAKGSFAGVVLIGFSEAGEFEFRSTYADGGTVIWLLEMAKKKLLETRP